MGNNSNLVLKFRVMYYLKKKFKTIGEYQFIKKCCDELIEEINKKQNKKVKK